jgi:hypothetical protein
MPAGTKLVIALVVAAVILAAIALKYRVMMPDPRRAPATRSAS